jgi:hypothetical protein
MANWLYLIGSCCFAAGTLRNLLVDRTAYPRLTNLLYLAGSVCFAAGTITNMVGSL